MGKIYRVVQGDYLAKIARKHGFADWRTIYYHEKNTTFREKRKNPDLIYPGDKIYIPDKNNQTDTVDTGRRHRFRLKMTKVSLFLELKKEDDSALEIEQYILNFGSHSLVRKSSDADYCEKLKTGIVEELLLTDETTAYLFVQPVDKNYEEQKSTLKLGALDPIDETTGIQGRLYNLGHYTGKIDGIKGPETEDAIRAFQEKYGLKVDGEPGPATQAKLQEVYGC